MNNDNFGNLSISDIERAANHGLDNQGGGAPIQPQQPVNPNLPPMYPNQPPVNPDQPPVNPNQPPVNPNQPPINPGVYPPIGTPPNVFVPQDDNPGFGKLLLLSIVTCGIYLLVYYYKKSERIKTLFGYHSAETLMNFLLVMFLVAPATCGIFNYVWQHKFSRMVGDELRFRNIDYDFGAKDFWLWNILGMFILVGPFIYLYKLNNAFELIENDIAARNSMMNGGAGYPMNGQPDMW